MTVALWTFGRSKAPWLVEARDQYLKRLKPLVRLDYLELAGIKLPRKPDAATTKRLEAEHVLAKLAAGDRLILFDERGRAHTSRAFAQYLERLQHQGGSRIVLLVGGAYGFDESLYARAEGKLRVSDMTFSHQLVRVLILEQLYRAYAILNNHPYHND